jgi:hypothetical protein
MYRERARGVRRFSVGEAWVISWHRHELSPAHQSVGSLDYYPELGHHASRFIGEPFDHYRGRVVLQRAVLVFKDGMVESS